MLLVDLVRRDLALSINLHCFLLASSAISKEMVGPLSRESLDFVFPIMWIFGFSRLNFVTLISVLRCLNLVQPEWLNTTSIQFGSGSSALSLMAFQPLGWQFTLHCFIWEWSHLQKERSWVLFRIQSADTFASYKFAIYVYLWSSSYGDNVVCSFLRWVEAISGQTGRFGNTTWNNRAWIVRMFADQDGLLFWLLALW